MSLNLAPSLPPLVAERPEDAAAVEALVLRAFGPGRYAKAAERLREGRRPILDLSFVAWEGQRPVGCVRLWRVRVGETPGL
ncbi:MAG: GNAT family N-acetyltransferase, partial [Caulobacteraceae bacterium]